MPKVSISEAARLAGITRQHFYKKYINPGVISVERDNEAKPVIDTSELFRVIGELKGDKSKATQTLQSMTPVMTPENDSKITILEAKLQLAGKQLTAAADREKWLQGKVDQLAEQLASTTRLLEHKPGPEAPKRGFLFRLFGR